MNRKIIAGSWVSIETKQVQCLNFKCKQLHSEGWPMSVEGRTSLRFISGVILAHPWSWPCFSLQAGHYKVF